MNVTTPTEVNRELENLSTRMTRVERDMQEQNKILYELRDMMVAARGSWKLIMGIAGLAGAIGAVAVKVIPFIAFKP